MRQSGNIVCVCVCARFTIISKYNKYIYFGDQWSKLFFCKQRDNHQTENQMYINRIVLYSAVQCVDLNVVLVMTLNTRNIETLTKKTEIDFPNFFVYVLFHLKCKRVRYIQIHLQSVSFFVNGSFLFFFLIFTFIPFNLIRFNSYQLFRAFEQRGSNEVHEL